MSHRGGGEWGGQEVVRSHVKLVEAAWRQGLLSDSGHLSLRESIKVLRLPFRLSSDPLYHWSWSCIVV